jgi:hydrophobic/amphiphilic exporter-1 (mainly G- bacteria), HAE1 family
MTGFELPRGYNWDKGQGYIRQQEQNQAQNFGVIMAITFVFLLMGILFESFILPLAVLIAIPFSFFGAYWGLYLTGTPFDELCGIGLIILIGVVVNNAIVLVDMIGRLRAQGMDREQAMLDAGKHRFRPILMTAATTIGGLIPMSVGGSRMFDMSYAPMGRTMLGGMITSTLITLVAVPLLYTFFDDLRRMGSRVAASFSRAGGGGGDGG